MLVRCASECPEGREGTTRGESKETSNVHEKSVTVPRNLSASSTRNETVPTAKLSHRIARVRNGAEGSNVTELVGKVGTPERELHLGEVRASTSPLTEQCKF